MLTILSAFLDGEGSQGVTELSRRLAMTKSMVHRGLTNLAKHNYVVRDESGSRYQLGFAIAEFGPLSVRPPDLHRLCRPAMERLCALTGLAPRFPEGSGKGPAPDRPGRLRPHRNRGARLTTGPYDGQAARGYSSSLVRRFPLMPES